MTDGTHRRAPLLDGRLSAAMALAQGAQVFADIGADHGRLSAVMLLSGARSALVADISAAALEKARDDLEKLEVLNARIPAAALSAQISRMEKAGAAILQQVREHPEKGRDIRKFVTYYLPTAVKILTTYADLSASGAGGENAKSLMSDVEKNAGTIASAFEAQLDALFAGEVLDVSSDIAVLDGMLSGDGLSGKNNLKLS